MKNTVKTWKTALAAALLGIALAAQPVRAAEEQAVTAKATGPVTVRVGEDIRVLLYNPNDEPMTVRVFAYNAMEGTGDETEDITIAPGRLRTFDFKSPREFTGLMGYRIVSGAGRAISEANALWQLIDSVQHRGPSWQSQTLGFSWGVSQTGGFLKRSGPGKPAVSGSWTISPAN